MCPLFEFCQGYVFFDSILEQIGDKVQDLFLYYNYVILWHC